MERSYRVGSLLVLLNDILIMIRTLLHYLRAEKTVLSLIDVAEPLNYSEEQVVVVVMEKILPPSQRITDSVH